MDHYIQKAKQIISENIYCTLSTSSLDGKPWISPVFFAFDDKYNIYWASNKDSRHSTLLRSNPQAAIVIFDSKAPEGEGDGVYFETEVIELSDINDIENAMEIYNSRVTQNDFRIKKMDDVTGNGVWRIYKAVPKIITKLTEGEFINGQYTDKRIKIKLV